MEWIEIENENGIKRIPPNGKRVYVLCENIASSGKVFVFQTIAEYIPKNTINEEDFMMDDFWGEGDYDEEKDIYYTPEGFYEWQSETDINYKITAKVTHWMPLIEPPKPKN